MYSINRHHKYWAILGRIRKYIDQIYANLNGKILINLSRAKAHALRADILKVKNNTIVDSNLKKEIKEYCADRFGSENYWPWIALYTEIRGEFKKGWIPQDYYRLYLLKKFNQDAFSNISVNKSFDYKLFKEFCVPPIIFRISNVFYDENFINITKQDAELILRNHNDEVVMKKDEGRGGGGVTFVHSGQIVLTDGKDDRNFVIQPLVRQCEALKALHPESVNTLRVFTYLNKEGNAIELFTLLRFGSGNARIDHAGAGGGFCYISKNGKVDPFYYDESGSLKGDRHPDTQVEFGQINIPNYERAIQKCIDAHESYPYVKFIGWDLTIDEYHKPVLLEWNARHPGFWLKEALFGPFLKGDIE